MGFGMLRVVLGDHLVLNSIVPDRMPGGTVSLAILGPVTWTGRGRPPTVVRLAAEHTDDFLWNDSPDRFEHDDRYVLDPADLGVPQQLIDRLAAWNLRWSRMVLDLDPGWDDPAMQDSWRREGLELAHDLQNHLGPDVDVVYAEDDDPRPVRERRGR
jgi:hypothetical protein